MKANGTCRPG